MKQFFTKFLNRPWYPLCFSLYPALALLAHNADQVSLGAGIRPALVSLLTAGVLFLFLRLVLHEWHRSAFALALLLILFFTYGQVFTLLQAKDVPHLKTWMPLVALILVILVFVLATHKTWKFSGVAPSLNVVSLGLVLFAIGQAIHDSAPKSIASVPLDSFLPAQEAKLPAGQPAPDIYYIILDSYARADRLETMGYDNSDFIHNLEEMGFYVPRCTQSNYSRTDVSLASTLNMEYIQNISDTFTTTSIRRGLLFALLKNSAVRQILEENGYTTYAFATGFYWSELTDADVYISPSPFSPTLTEFEAMFLETTPALHLPDLGLLNPDKISGDHFRERTELVLEHLTRIPQEPGPKFIFVHLIIPHPPFVFGPDGEEIDSSQFLNQKKRYTRGEFTRGYLDEVTYINSRMEEILSQIIDQSSNPPVIILQGDHGPWFQSQTHVFEILNAYYLPGNQDDLYPQISPVNSFRIVMNNYLGMDLPLLKDLSYYSPIPHIYDFKPTPNLCKDP